MKNHIVIDLAGCRRLGDVHEALREGFGLPAFYGQNWDALWDLTCGLWRPDDAALIEVRDLPGAERRIRGSLAPLRAILHDLQAACPGLEVLYRDG